MSTFGPAVAVDRFTRTPLFLNYCWRSDAFINHTWAEAAADLEGINHFSKFLQKLDIDEFPRMESMDLDNAIFRAHLGLENQFGEVATTFNSKASYACWTTLLRFQVLDLLLSMTYGVSDAPCIIAPPPTGSSATDLLRALAKWPEHLQSLQRARLKAKTKRLALKNKPDITKEIPVPEENEDDVVDESLEGFNPVLALSGMHATTLATKTEKNLQAMGAALMWILESRALPYDIWPPKKLVSSTFKDLSEKLKLRLNALTVDELLRPLSYAINSSPIVAFCNFDLQHSYGNMRSQYQTRLFLGRYQTPKLGHMVDIVHNVIRAVGVGYSVETSLESYLDPALDSLPQQVPGDTEMFYSTVLLSHTVHYLTA
ncbi:hypothetical protein B0H13DRAFT_2378473 [Mycena leptocephala]|nr:hypothetical protein B0H13DRAFT_2378473 [Mycena leptocephala]